MLESSRCGFVCVCWCKFCSYPAWPADQLLRCQNRQSARVPFPTQSFSSIESKIWERDMSISVLRAMSKIYDRQTEQIRWRQKWEKTNRFECTSPHSPSRKLVWSPDWPHAVRRCWSSGSHLVVGWHCLHCQHPRRRQCHSCCSHRGSHPCRRSDHWQDHSCLESRCIHRYSATISLHLWNKKSKSLVVEHNHHHHQSLTFLPLPVCLALGMNLVEHGNMLLRVFDADIQLGHQTLRLVHPAGEVGVIPTLIVVSRYLCQQTHAVEQFTEIGSLIEKWHLPKKMQTTTEYSYPLHNVHCHPESHSCLHYPLSLHKGRYPYLGSFKWNNFGKGGKLSWWECLYLIWNNINT